MNYMTWLHFSPWGSTDAWGGANKLTEWQEVVTTDIVLQPGFVSANIETHNETAGPERQIVLTGKKVKGVGKFDFYSRDGRTITFSGFGSRDNKGNPSNGVIGTWGKSLEEWQDAARWAAQNFLNNLLIATHGNLDGVKAIDIQVLVNCTPDFIDHPKVADAASEFLIAIFGFLPTRTAVGNPSLPNGMSVEIKANVTISEELEQKLDLRDAKELITMLNNLVDNVVQECAGQLCEWLLWLKERVAGILNSEDKLNTHDIENIKSYVTYVLSIRKEIQQKWSQKLKDTFSQNGFPNIIRQRAMKLWMNIEWTGLKWSIVEKDIAKRSKMITQLLII